MILTKEQLTERTTTGTEYVIATHIAKYAMEKQQWIPRRAVSAARQRQLTILAKEHAKERSTTRKETLIASHIAKHAKELL